VLEGVGLVHPAAHGIAQLLLVVGKIEIHKSSPGAVIPGGAAAWGVQQSSV
jgi:hypothetical protein